MTDEGYGYIQQPAKGKKWGVPTTGSAFNAVAEDPNLEIVYPKANELLLDLDSEKAYKYFRNNLWILEEHFGVLEVRERPSKSGGEHKHVYISLGSKLTTVTRMLLQAAMGSDPKRELLGYIMYAKGKEEKPTLLIEKKIYPNDYPEVKE